MKAYLFFLLFIPIAVCQSCGKLKKKVPYYTMEPGFKKTFLQGWTGSYWIYSDSLRTYYDTTTLVTVGKGIGEKGNNYQAEEYSTHYKATNCKDYFTKMSTIRSYVNHSDTNEAYYTFDMSSNTGVIFSVQLRRGQYSMPGGGAISHLDSVTLLGKTYYNVIKLAGGPVIIIDPDIGIIYKEAWSVRPRMGVKKFYLIDHLLK